MRPRPSAPSAVRRRARLPDPSSATAAHRRPPKPRRAAGLMADACSGAGWEVPTPWWTRWATRPTCSLTWPARSVCPAGPAAASRSSATQRTPVVPDGTGFSLALVGAYMLAHALATHRTTPRPSPPTNARCAPFVSANQALVDNSAATLFPTTVRALEQRNTMLRGLDTMPAATSRPAHGPHTPRAPALPIRAGREARGHPVGDDDELRPVAGLKLRHGALHVGAHGEQAEEHLLEQRSPELDSPVATIATISRSRRGECGQLVTVWCGGASSGVARESGRPGSARRRAGDNSVSPAAIVRAASSRSSAPMPLADESAGARAQLCATFSSVSYVVRIRMRLARSSGSRADLRRGGQTVHLRHPDVPHDHHVRRSSQVSRTASRRRRPHRPR